MRSIATAVSCNIISCSPRLAVLRLSKDGKDKTYTGLNVELSAGKNTRGVAVLQRFPLLFVYGNFSSVEIGTSCTLVETDPSTFEVSSRCVTADSLVNDNCVDRNDNISSEHIPTFEKCPDVSQIQTISEPLHTGISCIDVLTPIGRGQNMLFIDPPFNKSAQGYTGGATSIFSSVMNKYSTVNDGVVAPRAFNSVTEKSLQCVYVSADSISLTPASQTMLPLAMNGSSDIEPTIEECARYWVLVNMATSLASNYRRNGKDSLVILGKDLRLLEKFWAYSSQCLMDSVYKIDYSPTEIAPVYDAAANNSERRLYYASIFQQVGKYNDSLGGGSLTLFCGTQDVLKEASASVDTPPSQSKTETEAVYSMDDFKNSDDPRHGTKVLFRLQVLVDRDISLTAAVLNKLNIPLPNSVIADSPPAISEEIAFAQETTSLTDGHIVFYNHDSIDNSEKISFNTTGIFPAIVPCQSLSRVGTNMKKAQVRKYQLQAINSLTDQLRYQLSLTNDLMPSDNSADAIQQRIRAISWICALSGPIDLNTSNNKTIYALTLSEQVVLLVAVYSGLYDKYVRNGSSLELTECSDWQQFKFDQFTRCASNDLNRKMLSYVLNKVDLSEVESTGELVKEKRHEIEACVREFFDSSLI